MTATFPGGTNMKKIIIISVVSVFIIIGLLSFLFYFDFFEMHKGEKAHGAARDFYVTAQTLLTDEDIYNNIDDSFTLSSVDKYSDSSDAIDSFKKELESKSKYKDYEYYIEVEDKNVTKIICSRSKYISIVGSYGPETVHCEGEAPVRNFMDEVKKSYDSFKP